MGRPKKEVEETVEPEEIIKEEIVEKVAEKTNILKLVEKLRESLLVIDLSIKDFSHQGRSVTRLIYARREITTVLKYIAEL